MNRRNFIKTSGYLTLSSLFPAKVFATEENIDSGLNTKPLVLGIFPRRNTKLTFKLFSPIAKHLSSILNREVQIVTAKNFKTFWKGVASQHYDIVHFNQYHYIISNLLYNYQVIVKNQEFGNSTIAGSICVRKDSGIDTIQDLKNKTIMFGGGKMAMQSYIAAKWLLQQGGLNEGDYIEKIAINPPNAIISTYNKQADAAGAGDIVIRLETVKKQIDVSQMRYIAQTEQLPHLPWAVKGSMDEFTKLKIQSSLSSLHKDPAGQLILDTAQLSSLSLAVDSDYDSHRKIISDVYGKDYGVSKFK